MTTEKCLFRHPRGRFCGEPKGHVLPHRMDPELGNCAARGCVEPIPRTHLMCPPHWSLVPAPLRVAVEAAYHSGGASDWLAASEAAVDAVAAKGGAP